jgi:hypothetical protein
MGHLFGAICPERCVGAAIVMPEVNVEAMNELLTEISRHVSVGAIALLVLDDAGCHSRHCRRWVQPHVEGRRLPPSRPRAVPAPRADT